MCAGCCLVNCIPIRHAALGRCPFHSGCFSKAARPGAGEETKPKLKAGSRESEQRSPVHASAAVPFTVGPDSDTLGARRAGNTPPYVRSVPDTAHKALGLESSTLAPLLLITPAATIAKTNTQGFLVARPCPRCFIHVSSFNSHNPCESICKAEAGGSLRSAVSTE